MERAETSLAITSWQTAAITPLQKEKCMKQVPQGVTIIWLTRTLKPGILFPSQKTEYQEPSPKSREREREDILQRGIHTTHE